MTKALISIDYTEDFVADSGKLTAGAPAQAISDAISKVTRLAFERGDYIFFTIDAHEENDCFHPESKLFPPHNLIGTSGRNLYGDLGDLLSRAWFRTVVSFGWINAITQLFQGLTWISV